MVALVKTANRVRLCVVLLIVNVVFIWGNSLLPAELSKAFSNLVYKLLQLFVSGSEGQGEGGTGLLRKLAHLTEFACFGALWCWYWLMSRKSPWLGLLPGLCVASVDETIQCFVPGRGPRVTDVAIDLLGVSLGIGALFLIITLKNRRNPT